MHTWRKDLLRSYMSHPFSKAEKVSETMHAQYAAPLVVGGRTYFPARKNVKLRNFIFYYGKPSYPTSTRGKQKESSVLRLAK